MITHINYKFDNKKLLEEVANLKFKRVCVDAKEYTPDSDGLVYLKTGSIVILDEDISYFEKTKDLTEGYHYDVAAEVTDFFGVKDWRVKVLRWSPGDKIFTHRDNPVLNPVCINHLFHGVSPIIFYPNKSYDYRTAILDIGGKFHKVVNTSNEIRYTLKIICMDKSYEELSNIAADLKVSI
mgnify:CR=1 FL=1|tara:strand:- start:1464 stop:2006 length:543 start_codon:yes stop_codon:yes gene_type:complete